MWPIWLRLQFLVLYLMKTPTAISAMTSKESNRFDYLSRQHPLWVLEDQVSSMERDISHITFTTTEKPHYPTYYLKYRRKKMVPNAGYYRKTSSTSPMRISLPTHYIYAGRRNFSRYHANKPTQTHAYWRRQQAPQAIPVSVAQLPTFDSVPNDIDVADDEVISPIFVYNGPKGELIMNTMLSTQKYPMQEPVPGEILYPPIAPIFRPKPIVQRFRVPGHTEPMNLTLIPFYAHEAIVPRFLYDYRKSNADSTADSTIAEATATATSPTAVLYAASRSTTTTTTITPETTTPKEMKKVLKKRRHKKAKHYAVYRSPDEVHWRPTEPIFSEFPSRQDVTTPYPMVLANPLLNHRYADSAVDLTTTLKPPTNFKLSYKDDDTNFQIVYFDESLEKPISREAMPTRLPTKRQRSTLLTPKPLPLLSSHYTTTDREYYAFPVYTLGKLLKPDSSAKSLPYPTHFIDNAINKKDSENDVDTWFIMNSRYKGHHRPKDGSKRLSSKYVEVPPAAVTHETEELAETTLETSLMRE